MFNVEINVDGPEYWPQRAHPADAGADLFSKEDAIVLPGESQMIDTGVGVKIPKGYVGLVFSRSGQGKVGVRLANSVGVIDTDYRGNIKVILTNDCGTHPYHIKAKDTKVAQLVIVPIMLANFVPYQGEWDNTIRSTKGFGSTGQ